MRAFDERELLALAMQGAEMEFNAMTEQEEIKRARDFLREAEGRAAEFDHEDRAGIFGAAARKLEEKILPPSPERGTGYRR